MRRAAFFDLDGTLLTVNSAGLWVRRERRLGRLRRRQVALAAGWFALYKLGLLDIERAMAEAAGTVAGELEETLRRTTSAWYEEEVSRHAAPKAFEAVERHRAAGDLLVLLTSSTLWTGECAARQFGLHEVLCNRFEVQDGRLTGRVERPLCYGPGKVTLAERLCERHGIDPGESSFYTDSYTDLPMLLRVREPRVVSPDPRLRLEARRRDWPVLEWRESKRR